MVKRKQCTQCKKKFPATTKFFHRRQSKAGLHLWCKVCRSASHAAWRVANPEKKRASDAKWRAANRAGAIAYSANWRAPNPLHGTWKQMLYRCTDKKRKDWKSYGAIGVRVCSRWSDPEHGYDNFVADMGPKPTPQHTLGRFGDIGNYEPGNCAWQTWAEQGMEKRKNNALLQQAA